jgi:hypothetical protein
VLIGKFPTVRYALGQQYSDCLILCATSVSSQLFMSSIIIIMFSLSRRPGSVRSQTLYAVMPSGGLKVYETAAAKHCM